MLPELATGSTDAGRRASLHHIKGRIVILVQRVKRSPEVGWEQSRDPFFANQGRVGSILVRKLIVIAAQVDGHCRRDRINRVSRYARPITVTAIYRQKFFVSWI